MCGSDYTDRRSRSEPAYVDPSLRRRMSCFLTPNACIDSHHSWIRVSPIAVQTPLFWILRFFHLPQYFAKRPSNS